MTERVLLIHELGSLRSVDTGRFRRIYFGTDTCPAAFPTGVEIQSFFEFCRSKNISGTLVTPFIPERHYSRIAEAISAIPENQEIVLNDLGLLKPALSGKLMPVLGRIFLPLKKDIRAESFAADAPQFRFNARFFDFYRTLGFIRFEADRYPASFFQDGPEPGSCAFSLYYPQVITNINAAVCQRCNAEAAAACRNYENDIRIEKGTPETNQWFPVQMKENYLYYTAKAIPPEHQAFIDRIIETPY